MNPVATAETHHLLHWSLSVAAAVVAELSRVGQVGLEVPPVAATPVIVEEREL
jgi:hypothetical protein